MAGGNVSRLTHPAELELIRQMLRLREVVERTAQPSTLAQVAQALFPEADGYNQLLALEETGAHVEYLFARGYLSCVQTGVSLAANEGLCFQARPDRPMPVLPASSEGCASVESFRPPAPAG